MTYEETIKEQDNFLALTFKNMSKADIKLVAKHITKLVDEGVLSEDDFEDIRSVVVWGSIRGFYDLETHPREELWKVLKQLFGGREA